MREGSVVAVDVVEEDEAWADRDALRPENVCVVDLRRAPPAADPFARPPKSFAGGSGGPGLSSPSLTSTQSAAPGVPGVPGWPAPFVDARAFMRG